MSAEWWETLFFSLLSYGIVAALAYQLGATVEARRWRNLFETVDKQIREIRSRM